MLLMGALAGTVGESIDPGLFKYLFSQPTVISGMHGWLRWVIDGAGDVLPRWVNANSYSLLPAYTLMHAIFCLFGAVLHVQS